MKVLLEVFLVTPETDDQIGYRRREFDISEDPRDPDELVHAALSDRRWLTAAARHPALSHPLDQLAACRRRYPGADLSGL